MMLGKKILEKKIRNEVNEQLRMLSEVSDIIPKKVKDNLEIVGDKVRLYHYGAEKLKGNLLDPSFFGKHRFTSDVKTMSGKVIFFYVNPNDREKMISGTEYIVEYPLNKLYPFNTDPMDYLGKYERETGESIDVPTRQRNIVMDAAKKDGYGGLIENWENTLRVILWEKVKPVNISDKIEIKIPKNDSSGWKIRDGLSTDTRLDDEEKMERVLYTMDYNEKSEKEQDLIINELSKINKNYNQFKGVREISPV